MKTLAELKSDEGFINYLAKSTEQTVEKVLKGFVKSNLEDLNSEHQLYVMKAEKLATTSTSGSSKIVVCAIKRVMIYDEGLIVYHNSERDKAKEDKDITKSQLMFGYVLIDTGKEEVPLYQTARQLNRLGQISGISLDTNATMAEHNNKDIPVNIEQWHKLKAICSGSTTDIGTATADVRITKRVAGDSYEMKNGETGFYEVTKNHFEIVQVNKNYGLTNMMIAHTSTAQVAYKAKKELRKNSMFA